MPFGANKLILPVCSYFICHCYSGLLLFWSKPAVSRLFAPILFATSIPTSCFFGANLPILASLLLFYLPFLFKTPAFLEQTCCFFPLCSYFICHCYSSLLLFWSKPAVSRLFAPILFATSIPTSCFFGANLPILASLLLISHNHKKRNIQPVLASWMFHSLVAYRLHIFMYITTTYIITNIAILMFNIYTYSHCNSHVQYLYLQSLQFSYSVFTLTNIAMLIHLFTSPRTGRVPAVSPSLAQAKHGIRDTP